MKDEQTGHCDDCGTDGVQLFPKEPMRITRCHECGSTAIIEPKIRLSGAELIAIERQRQIEEEGYEMQHDDEHDAGELLAAAICYAHNAGQFKSGAPREWPWRSDYWKPTAGNPVRDLVKAGALIAAEIDRINRNA